VAIHTQDHIIDKTCQLFMVGSMLFLYEVSDDSFPKVPAIDWDIRTGLKDIPLVFDMYEHFGYSQ
jgi:hypothetical protein